MTIALIRSPDAPESLPGCQSGAPAKPPRKKRPRWTPRPRPLDRSQLDGRTKGAMLFDQLVAEIVADLGGPDQISTIEQGLVVGYVAARLGVEGFSARIAAGQAVDWSEFAGTASTMIRAAARLRPWRRLKLIDRVPTVEEYSAHKKRQRETAVVAEVE
jgi:hypothetical protein